MQNPIDSILNYIIPHMFSFLGHIINKTPLATLSELKKLIIEGILVILIIIVTILAVAYTISYTVDFINEKIYQKPSKDWWNLLKQKQAQRRKETQWFRDDMHIINGRTYLLISIICCFYKIPLAGLPFLLPSILFLPASSEFINRTFNITVPVYIKHISAILAFVSMALAIIYYYKISF